MTRSFSYRSIKRVGDLFFSSFVLLIGLPLFLLIAFLVKVSSPGPVFFVQQRVGCNHTSFGCIKFRTMSVDAEDSLSRVLAQSPLMKKEFESDFKLKKDPRVTPIGKILRRSSLDELPQFINIIRGQMSLVGPRPIVEKEISRYGEFMEKVLSVRPGLTGLWQVSGRNNLTYEQRVSIDYQYVNSFSFLIDLMIILRTFGVLLIPKDRGAY